MIFVKRTFKIPSKERGSRFDIQKLFIPVCGRLEDSCITHLGKFFCFFLLCLKSISHFGNSKFQKSFFEGYGFVIKLELDNLPHQACYRWHCFEIQLIQKILHKELDSQLTVASKKNFFLSICMFPKILISKMKLQL